ncbi:MAG: MATE family efflux transporter [Eubacteriales bacterium]|nr:MATE family efflux transporter [Eubacteriales bacterium]
MPHRIDNEITEGSLVKAFAKYIFPLLLGGIIQQSYSVIDALIVGNYLGKEALAATDSPMAFIRLLVSAFLALSGGGSILISLLYGAKDFTRVRQTVKRMMQFSVIAGFIITVISILITPLGLRIMLVPEELLPLSRSYLTYYFLGTAFVLAYNMASGILRAVGDSKNPFIYLCISAVSNIVLDLLFVAVFKWGVAGAAIATVLSQVIATILIVLKLIRIKECYGLELAKIEIPHGTLWRAIKLGLPMAAQSVIFSVANMYMQRGINSFGTDGIAGWTIIGKVDVIVFILAETLGLTVTTFVAQNLGAGKLHRLKRTIYLALGTSAVLYASMALLFYFQMPFFAKFFTQDTGAIAKAVEFIQIIAPFHFCFAITEIFNSASKGSGNTVTPMMITLLAIGIFRILWMSIVYTALPSARTVVIGYPISWGLAAAFSVLQYFVSVRKKFAVVK